MIICKYYGGLMHSAHIGNTGSDLNETLLNSLEFIKWKNQIKKDSTVFIKPNFTFPYYKEGVTTSPELLRNLLEIIKDRADKVIVGESDGGSHSFTADEAFKGHNMYEICRETGADLVNLSKMPSVIVKDKIQGKNVKVQLPKLLLNEVDCFVSVPVLKVHVMTKISLSIKNLWGCYPDTMRGLHHQNLNEKLSLITKRLDPKIVVIDGIYGLDGHGPMFGDPVKMDLIISADNPVVADTIGTSIMGFSPNKIGHIMTAEKEGLGTTNLENMRTNIDWKPYLKEFHVNKTLLDTVSILPFKSDLIAKVVMDSPFKPLIYRVASKFKTPDEKNMWEQK